MIKALTEPQPFSWEGRYHQFRTLLLSGRGRCSSPAANGGGDQERRHAPIRCQACWAWRCPSSRSTRWPGWLRSITPGDEAGWQPTPDQIIYRGNIYLAETDQQAATWLEGVGRAGPVPGGIALRPSVSRAVQAARAGEEFDLRHILAGSVQGRGWRCPRAELHGAGLTPS